jgi:hypothetical protein
VSVTYGKGQDSVSINADLSLAEAGTGSDSVSSVIVTLKSLSDDGVGVDTAGATWGVFSFRIVTTGADTFELPINGGGSGYKHNFVVDWGDGGATSRITAYNDSDRTHSYAGAGTYDITIAGICEWFCFNNGGDKGLVTELLSFDGDLGLKVLNFTGCNYLTTAVPLGTLASLTTAYYMFDSCYALAAIPAGLFDGCPNILSFQGCFRYCTSTSLTSIPAGLFDVCTSATSFAAAFYNCTKITAIPDDLFKYNTVVTSFAQLFMGVSAMGLTSIGNPNFRTTASCTFADCFRYCSSLTSIPANLFDICVNANSFQETFYTCVNLTAIPDDLFKYNTAVTSFVNTFYQCANLTSTGSPNFRTTAACSFASCFENCMGLTSIASGLFDTCVNATSFAGTFKTCYSLASIPANLFDNNVAVTTFNSVFYGCNNASLTEAINGDIFKYNVVAVNYGNAFYDCHHLTGHGWGPAEDANTIMYWPTQPGHSAATVTAGCFGLCAALTDYADIPAEWK